MRLPWYPRYSADYRRDTQHLSLAEHGAYALLLDTYYANGPLPAELATLARICAAAGPEERAAVQVVADQFFPISSTDGARHNKRADQVRADMQARSDLAARKAKSRWNNAPALPQHSRSNTPASAAALPQQSPSNAIHIESTSHTALPQHMPQHHAPQHCAYCSSEASGRTNNLRHCNEHTHLAVQGIKPTAFRLANHPAKSNGGQSHPQLEENPQGTQNLAADTPPLPDTPALNLEHPGQTSGMKTADGDPEY